MEYRLLWTCHLSQPPKHQRSLIVLSVTVIYHQVSVDLWGVFNFKIKVLLVCRQIRAFSDNNRWHSYCPTSLLIWADSRLTPIQGKNKQNKTTTRQAQKHIKSWWGSEICLRWLQQSKSTSIKPARSVVGASPVNIIRQRRKKGFKWFKS